MSENAKTHTGLINMALIFATKLLCSIILLGAIIRARM